jgi:hypothetical protein
MSSNEGSKCPRARVQLAPRRANGLGPLDCSAGRWCVLPSTVKMPTEQRH